MSKIAMPNGAPPALTQMSDDEASSLALGPVHVDASSPGELTKGGSFSLRFRDAASWIRKDDNIRPPASPITTDQGVLSPSNDDGKVKQLRQLFDPKTKPQQQEPKLSKVKELASIFDARAEHTPLPKPGKRQGSFGQILQREGSESRVRELAYAFSPKQQASSAVLSPSRTSPSISRLVLPSIERPVQEGVIEAERHKPVADLTKVFDKPSIEAPLPVPVKAIEFKKRVMPAHHQPRSSPMVVVPSSDGPIDTTPTDYSAIDEISLGRSTTQAALSAARAKVESLSSDSSEDSGYEPELEPLIDEVDVLPLEKVDEDPTNSDDESSDLSEGLANSDEHIFVLKGSFTDLVPRRLRSSALVSSQAPVLHIDESLGVGDLNKPWRDFYKAVLEIVTTEHGFLSRWHTAHHYFVKPMLARLGEERTCRLVPLNCWHNIFRFHEALLQELMESLDELWGSGFTHPARMSASLGMEELIKGSQENITILSSRFREMEMREVALTQVRVEAWFLKLNATMLRHADALIIAREFIVHHPTAMRYLETMSSKKKAFVAYLESAPELQGLKFRDFLVQPVQNVCRYHLLYKAVVDKAPGEELSAAALSSRAKFASLAQRVNEAMKHEERKDAEELMARLKSHANHKFVSKLLPRGLRQVRNSLSSSELDTLNLNDVTAVPIRQGDIQIISVSGPHEDVQALSDSLASRGKATGLLCMNQLLLIEASRRWSGRDPIIFHSFRFTLDWKDVRVEEDADHKDVIHLEFESDAHRDDAVRVSLQVPDETKQGWLRDLKEVCRLAESARQRQLVAQLQMSKRRSLTATQSADLASLEEDRSSPSSV